MSVHQFVITGGPCSGKTTSLSVLHQKFSDRGFKVIVSSEVVTDVISSGIFPWEIPTIPFQKLVSSRMINKEKTTLEVVRCFEEDVIIFYDRALLDNKAYMSDEEFSRLMELMGLTEIKVRDRYDAVFHLVTTAKGAEKYYTLSNNEARKESIEEARRIDTQTMNCWVGHPHFRVIDNSTDFEGKVDKLISEVSSALGIPVPIEIERKYLISMPNMEAFLKKYKCTCSQIFQTYLESKDDIERRIRQRGDGKSFSYYYTEKQNISGISRTEREKKITEREYLMLISEADRKKKPIRKNRYCFVYENQYFEMDIYPEWDDKAILEIELTSESQEVKLPEDITIIKEVTSDPDYKNSALASKF